MYTKEYYKVAAIFEYGLCHAILAFLKSQICLALD